MPIRSRLLTICALLAGAVAATSARGDVVFFKDGFFLHGKVSQDGETIVDNGQAFTVPSGPFFLIDFPRSISFSRLQVEDANNKDIQPDFMVLRRPPGRFPQPKPIYPLINLEGASKFDDKGERNFYMLMPDGKKIAVEQRWTVLTPQYTRIEARRYLWNAFYRTTELGPKMVRGMLENHPAIKKKPEKDQAFEIARFFAQVGWYEESEKLMKEFEKEYPNEKDRVDLALGQLVKFNVEAKVKEIELARKAGRHEYAQKLCARFPFDDTTDISLVTRVRIVQRQYENEEKMVDKARRFLNTLAPRLTESEHRFLSEAAGLIRTELTVENIKRLGAFIDLAEQAELDLKKGRKPLNTPPQLLSLAVNGWLLGIADARTESAYKTWRGRQFLAGYLARPDARARLLQDYNEGKNSSLEVDELAQVVRSLPPPTPEAVKGDKVLDLEAPSVTRTKAVKYALLPPPEYTHHRRYPVLIALHHKGEGPKDMIERCRKEAARHGYLLASVDWGGGLFQERYNYTAEEHDAVLSVVRDLRNRFRVDSDRVFLIGFGEGGNMAIDVGMSHPDQFAGVLPMCGTTRQSNERQPCVYPERYQYNNQYLPFFVVNGSHTGEHAKLMKTTFQKWSQYGHPALHIEYLGRGLEWFSGEVPTMFDWMDRQKRATAFPTLGKRDFHTMRAGDNRFYWISTSGISSRNLNDPRQWNQSVLPATMHARIGGGNQINFNSRGLHQVTLWFGRDADGRNMISHKETEPAKIYNGSTLVYHKPIPRSLDTLLEDLATRGDREMMFWSKISFEWR